MEIEMGDIPGAVVFSFDPSKVGVLSNVQVYKRVKGNVDEKIATITIAEIRSLARALGV